MEKTVCAGKPCISDTACDVATIVGALGIGQSIQDVQDTFHLTYEQVLTALRYASYVTDHLPLRMPLPSSET